MTGPTDQTQLSYSPVLVSASGDQLDRAIREYGFQTGVMKIQNDKTMFAMQQISELHKHGTLSKEKTLTFLQLLDATVEYADPFKQIWADSLREQVLMYIDQIHKLLRIGAKNIALEADRTLHLPELPPQRPGLLLRILRSIVGGNS